jgi:hypothetical protein
MLTFVSLLSLAQTRVNVPVLGSDKFNVISFGSKADGISLNTISFQPIVMGENFDQQQEKF